MHSGDMIFVATVMLLAPIGLSIYLVCCWKKIVGRTDGNSVEGTVQQEQQHQRYVEYVFFCEEMFSYFFIFSILQALRINSADDKVPRSNHKVTKSNILFQD